jgi:hypothetical protein
MYVARISPAWLRYVVARGAPNPLEGESVSRVLVEKHDKRE